MFKKLFILMLLSGAFLGGYYLGYQPDSPDIFAWAKDTYNQANDAGSKLSAIMNDEPGNMLETVEGGKDVAVEVDGKVYYVSRAEQQEGKHKP